MKSITECYSSTPLNAILRTHNGQRYTYKEYLSFFGCYEIEEKFELIYKIRNRLKNPLPEKPYYNKVKIALLVKKLKEYLKCYTN